MDPFYSSVNYVSQGIPQESKLASYNAVVRDSTFEHNIYTYIFVFPLNIFILKTILNDSVTLMGLDRVPHTYDFMVECDIGTEISFYVLLVCSLLRFKLPY